MVLFLGLQHTVGDFFFQIYRGDTKFVALSKVYD